MDVSDLYDDDDDSDDVEEIPYTAQGFSQAKPSSSSTTAGSNAENENDDPQCFANAFLFTSHGGDKSFTSEYGTVKNLKIQYGKF